MNNSPSPDMQCTRGPSARGVHATLACRHVRVSGIGLTIVLITLGLATPVQAAGPTLFTTPEQREQLDRIRAEATAEELARAPEPEPEPQAAPAPKPPPRVHLRGFVRRSNGPEAVWVNSGNTFQGSAVGEDLNAGRVEGGTVVVTLPDGKQVRLKPGQTWDPDSGTVVDVQGD